MSLNQSVGSDDEGELGDLFADRDAADPFDEAEESLRELAELARTGETRCFAEPAEPLASTQSLALPRSILELRSREKTVARRFRSRTIDTNFAAN